MAKTSTSNKFASDLSLGYLLDKCRLVGAEPAVVGASALAAAAHIASNNDKRATHERELEDAWYRSLAAGAPDYGVYADDRYIGELYACRTGYSRKYLLALQKLGLFDAAARLVVDLGCGVGFSTAGLKLMFPATTVVGTNLAGTRQRSIAEAVGTERGFTVQDAAAAEDGVADLVFASEYFEHFEAPVGHLRAVLDAAAPKMLVIANAFGSKAIGHFDAYLVDGEKESPAATSRAFNAELRLRGYAPVETKFWNNRPSVWRRAE